MSYRNPSPATKFPELMERLWRGATAGIELSEFKLRQVGRDARALINSDPLRSAGAPSPSTRVSGARRSPLRARRSSARRSAGRGAAPHGLQFLSGGLFEVVLLKGGFESRGRDPVAIVPAGRPAELLLFQAPFEAGETTPQRLVDRGRRGREAALQDLEDKAAAIMLKSVGLRASRKSDQRGARASSGFMSTSRAGSKNARVWLSILS